MINSFMFIHIVVNRGAAGLTGALTYAALTSLQFTPENTMLLMLIVPMIQLITFCIMLQEPGSGLWTTLTNASSTTSLINQSIAQQNAATEQSLTFSEKIGYFPKMLKYVVPLFSVYLCEYMINQVRSKSQIQSPYDRQSLSSDAFYFSFHEPGSFRFDVLQEKCSRPSSTISVAPSDISNWSICITFIIESLFH